MDRYFPLISFHTQHNYVGAFDHPLLQYQTSANTFSRIRNAGAIFRPTNGGFELFVTQHGLDIFKMQVEEFENKQSAHLVAAQRIPQSHSDNDDDSLQVEMDISPFLLFMGFAIDPYFSHFTQCDIKSGVNCFFVSNATQTDYSEKLHESKYLDSSAILPLTDSPYLQIIQPGERVNTPMLILSLSLQQVIQKFELDQTSVDYSVTFDNRKNYWKYFILGGERYTNLEIIDLDHNFEFDDYGKERLGDQESLVFISTNPIPFHKQFVSRFQLKEAESPDNQAVIERLPVARANQGFVKISDRNDAYVSEIFVNL